jgi:hypothetical protein
MKRQPDKWSLLFTFMNNSFNLELLKGETFLKEKIFPFNMLIPRIRNNMCEKAVRVL